MYIFAKQNKETKYTLFGTLLGNKSMEMFQRIVEQKTGQVKSTCKTILSGYDKQNCCSAIIPDDIKERFINYENS